MSTPPLTARRPAPQPVLDATVERYRKRRHAWKPAPGTLESVLVFAVAWVAYTTLGIWVVLHEHIVVFDGLSRLSHAYFVFWNSPPKLAAIGFVWPPVATLAFLPTALVRPLATSLVALPLTSGLFGALLIVVCERMFRLVRMERPKRYALVAAFGVNPMIAFYSSNGMAEALYLCLLMCAIYSYVRWYLTRTTGSLILAAVCFALGILTRYEVIGWAVLLTASITLVSIRQRVTRSELEGTLLTYLAPIAYGLGLWLFFNWLILGSPVNFLRQQLPSAPVAPGGSPVALPKGDSTPLEIAGKVASLNWHLFPPTILALIALGVVLFVRKDLMTATLAAIIVLNAAFTWLIVVGSGAEGYLQLRYNMRAMPLVLAGVAWLFLLARGRTRTVVWAASLVALLAAIPATARTMQTYRWQFRDADFISAVSGKGGLPEQLAGDRKMARYVRAHVRDRNAVLTDDAQTYRVLLLSGRPDLFFDRIDRGDGKWLDAREFPWGRVQYLLVAPGSLDLISQRYPGVERGAVPGLTPVYRAGGTVLVRVARVPPSRNRAQRG